MSRVLAKTVHLHQGAPVLGGRLSVQSSVNNTLEVRPEGVFADSTKSNRSILIPYSNITCIELFTKADLERMEAADRAREEAAARRKAAQAVKVPQVDAKG